MPAPYINQAPVDDDTDMKSDSSRPQGTDPQTMMILQRILTLLESQSKIPEPMVQMPAPGLAALQGQPPGLGGGGPPPMPGPGMPPPMPSPGMMPPPGGPPGMPPMPAPPQAGPPGPFTQYAQQRMMRPPMG